MTDLGAAFAAALDRGTGPDDDLLFPFDHKFRAGRIRNQLDQRDLHRMFAAKQVRR